MAKLLKLRRGTTSQHGSFTGAEGEVTVDTDKETLVVHDGSTAGGHAVAAEDMANVSSASIVGRLGTGSIANAKLTDDSIAEVKLDISNAPTDGKFLQYKDNTDKLTWATVNTDLSGDTTPQLGGNLDVNTKNIILGDSSDGASDDVIKFGAGTDLSIYSNGTEGILGILDGGTLKVKDGTNNLVTFSGASNQVDFHNDVVFIGASSNGAWDHSANKFLGNLTGTADVATEVTVTANNSTDETVYPVFVDGATGSQGAETDTGLAYNPSTGILSLAGLSASGNVTVTGNLTVNGSTTTVSTTNTTIEDNLIELNSGATSNANDAGILIERGSTGDNAIIAWDESADKFTVGTTTATNSATGDLTITTGTLVANVEGNVTGNVTGNTSGSSGSCTGNSAGFTAGNASNLNSGTVPTARLASGTASSSTFLRGDGTWQPATTPAGSNTQIQYNAAGSMGARNDVVIDGTNGIYAAGGFRDTYAGLRYVPSAYIYANQWVNSTSQIGHCLRAQGNFYLGSIATGAAVSVVNDTGSDITISRQTSYLYNTANGDNNTSYTLKSRGLVTFWYAASSTVYMSGSQVS